VRCPDFNIATGQVEGDDFDHVAPMPEHDLQPDGRSRSIGNCGGKKKLTKQFHRVQRTQTKQWITMPQPFTFRNEEVQVHRVLKIKN
jgi:hypothetical protein